MLSMIIILIALNVIPPDVDVFEIVDHSAKINGRPVKKVIRFTRQKAGDWQAVDLPEKQAGIYGFDAKSLKLIISVEPGVKQRYDIREILKQPKSVDWKKDVKIPLYSGGNARLSRQKTQVSVKLPNRPRKFIISWGKEVKK